jgi:putative ferrous iron transport protein C
MILSDLKRCLESRRQATLTDLALHLGAEPEAVREMLSVWERKGRVRRLPAPAGCGRTCTGCNPAASEVYLWVEPGEQVPTLPVAPGCGR